jgi:hypothetical protein
MVPFEDPLDVVEVDPLDVVIAHHAPCKAIKFKAAKRSWSQYLADRKADCQSAKKRVVRCISNRAYSDGFADRIEMQQCLSSDALKSDPNDMQLTKSSEVDAHIAVEVAFTLGLERIPRRAAKRCWDTISGVLGKLVDVAGLGSLLNRKNLSRYKLKCANRILHREAEVIDAMLRFDLKAVNYVAPGLTESNAGNLASAQMWIWDEATQHASMCSGIPLTAAYVRAVRLKESTKGIPMSIMQQMGHIGVDDLNTGTTVMDEVQVCGLEHIESTSGTCMIRCMNTHRKWHPGSDTPFTRSVRFQTHALIADGACSNGRVKLYDVMRSRAVQRARPDRFVSVLEIWEQCHCVHLVTAEQTLAFNADVQYCSVAQAAPNAKAKAKAKPKAKAQAKAYPARKVEFVSSMVRGSNLLSNARIWKFFVEGVEKFVGSKLVLLDRDPTPMERASAQNNKFLLSKTVLRMSRAKSTETDIDRLIALIGNGSWHAEANMQYFLTAEERLLDDVRRLPLRRGLVKRIASLVRSLFTRCQLPEINASRWTGIAKGSLWHASMMLFFGMLRWIVTVVLRWGGSVEDAEVLTLPSDPTSDRKFLGARRNLYVKFLNDYHCTMLSLAFTFCNAPIREVLGFLFANSYEARGSISAPDQERLERIYEKYLLDPSLGRRFFEGGNFDNR